MFAGQPVANPEGVRGFRPPILANKSVIDTYFFLMAFVQQNSNRFPFQMPGCALASTLQNQRYDIVYIIVYDTVP